MYPCTVYSEYAYIRSYSSLTLNLDFTKAKKNQRFRNSVDRSRAGVCFDDFERGTNVKLPELCNVECKKEKIHFAGICRVSKLYQIRNVKIYVLEEQNFRSTLSFLSVFLKYL